MSSNEHCHSDFGYAGPCTTFHRHYKRTMNGLNPHLLPCAPEVSDNKVKEENEAQSKGEKVDKQQSRINK